MLGSSSYSTGHCTLTEITDQLLIGCTDLPFLLLDNVITHHVAQFGIVDFFAQVQNIGIIRTIRFEHSSAMFMVDCSVMKLGVSYPSGNRRPC